MRHETRLQMSEGTVGSKPPPRRLERKASSQTVGSGNKKKKLTESSAKVMKVSETGPECATLQEGSKVRQRKTLNKVEKLNVMDRMKTFSSDTLSVVAMAEVAHQLPFNASDEFKQFCASLPVCSVRFLADGLKKEFVRLYEECATVADKYLKFQLKWHQLCSYYLVDSNRELSLIGLHPDDPIAVDVVSVRFQWHRIVMQYSLTKDDSKIFLILFCSCVYDELLRTCHSAIEVSQPTVQSLSKDSNDVYYRFGGAAISSMLHSRYTQIKSCALPQKERVSLELSVLQKLSIHNKEEKTHIPSYLKYRDNGYTV